MFLLAVVLKVETALELCPTVPAQQVLLYMYIVTCILVIWLCYNVKLVIVIMRIELCER